MDYLYHKLVIVITRQEPALEFILLHIINSWHNIDFWDKVAKGVLFDPSKLVLWLYMSVKDQITCFDNKSKWLEQKGEPGIQTSKLTPDLPNQVARLTNANKEQQKQSAKFKLNIEMALKKTNNLDVEYSDKI